MIVAGIDVGAATTKAVILNESGIISYAIRPTGFSVVVAADAVMSEALEKSGLCMGQL